MDCIIKMDSWDITRIESYISEEVEESLTLDYKAADSLQRYDEKKKSEVTKDVSAMANSTGGLLIYGIKEYSDKQRKHLPERIDPIDRSTFSKETLEHIINNIRPKITGLVIYPITIPNDLKGVVYVVEIPQSNTAHQASDKRYYKRFNFESVPMDDYEIRDIMFRARAPALCIRLYGKSEQTNLENRVYGSLFFAISNHSPVSAKNVVISVHLGSPLHGNRIDIPKEFVAGAALYRDPIHKHKKIWISKRDTIHKGLETTAVELEYELYTIEGARMSTHDIEFCLFADEMELVRTCYRITMSSENSVSAEEIEIQQTNSPTAPGTALNGAKLR